MNKLLIPLIAIAAFFLLMGCSTKFNVAAPYKNITVVYGFLDQSDTAHYIRIQKAFLDNNKSALTMAQTADSNYYASLNVKIERINFMNGGGVHDTIHLNRVNLDNEGYPKQPGIFFNSPNYAYKFTNRLDPNYSYRIVVSNPVTGEVDSAETPVIVDTNSTTFNVPDIDDSNSNRAGLSFFSVVISKLDEVDINGSYLAPSGYSFYGQNSPIGVAELIIRFNWIDSNSVTHSKSYHSSDYDFGFQSLDWSSPNPSNTFDYTVNNIDMYSAVKSALGTAPASTIRLIDRCNLFVYFSTPDYSTYEQIQVNQGTGLTGTQIQPIYTNVKGANALGLFTSRAVRSGYIAIDSRTVDSLIVSPIMSGTNLQGTAY